AGPSRGGRDGSARRSRLPLLWQAWLHRPARPVRDGSARRRMVAAHRRGRRRDATAGASQGAKVSEPRGGRLREVARGNNEREGSAHRGDRMVKETKAEQEQEKD